MQKSLRYLAGLTAVQFVLLTPPLLAHYLWVSVDAKPAPHGITNIYFEEGPAARDGQYLDPFVQRGKTWIRTVASPQPVLLETTDVKQKGKRWLTATLPGAAPRSVDSYGMFGVYRYGQTDVLLHYYARFLDVASHDDLHELARAEQLELDIIPHPAADGSLEITVLWQGKPAAGRQVFVRGPQGFKATLKTDEQGEASFQPTAAGQYQLRTNVEEKDRSGTQDGKEYQETRHHATLIMQLPVD